MQVLNRKNDTINFTSIPVRKMNWLRTGENGAGGIEKVMLTRLDPHNRKDHAIIKTIMNWAGGIVKETSLGNPHTAKGSYSGDFFALERPGNKGDIIGFVKLVTENGKPTIKRMVVKQEFVEGDNRSFNGIDELLIAGITALDKVRLAGVEKLDLGYSFAFTRIKEFIKACGVPLAGDHLEISHRMTVPSEFFDNILRYVGNNHQMGFGAPDLVAEAAHKPSESFLRKLRNAVSFI